MIPCPVRSEPELVTSEELDEAGRLVTRRRLVGGICLAPVGAMCRPLTNDASDLVHGYHQERHDRARGRLRTLEHEGPTA